MNSRRRWWHSANCCVSMGSSRLTALNKSPLTSEVGVASSQELERPPTLCHFLAALLLSWDPCLTVEPLKMFHFLVRLSWDRHLESEVYLGRRQQLQAGSVAWEVAETACDQNLYHLS